jgi:tetratricopeptide (TPR) repeat protein
LDNIERKMRDNSKIIEDTIKINPETCDKAKGQGLLPVNNLPVRKNPYFTGREDILKSIIDSFNAGKYVVLTQTVAGMGGVGKTQIALEYAFGNEKLYNVIWWVNAGDSIVLADSYKEFAKEKGLISEDEKKNIPIVVKNWMKSHNNWLFIFDNAENYESISKYLPKMAPGNILITSGSANWGRAGTVLDIDVFTPKEAVDFLTKRTGLNEKAMAEMPAEKLGYLPLALEQAGAYIAINKTTYEKYIEMYDPVLSRILGDKFKPEDYSPAVAATWNISINIISNESSKQFLKICAFLDSNNIRKEIFTEGMEYLPAPLKDVVESETKFNELISQLAEYSLIKLNDNGITIHRLLQDVIRQSVDRKEWCGYCLNIIRNSLRFNYYNPETWVKCAHILPHAISVAKSSAVLHIDLVKTAWIFHEAARWIDQTARYDEAEALYMMALEIKEAVLGKDHPGTAITYNNLALVYSNKGEYDKALKWFEKDLRISETVLGKDHLGTSTTYNNLALVYSNKGEYDKALEWYGKALRIRETVLGKEHPTTATTYNNLALVYDNKGEYDKALEWYEKALRIRETLLCKEHPGITTTYNNIAGVYSNKGEYDKALKWYAKALEINETALGKEHTGTATTYKNIAGVYSNKGDYDKALEWYVNAFNIFLNSFGINHPNTKIVRNNMYSTYMKSGREKVNFENWLDEKISGKKI